MKAMNERMPAESFPPGEFIKDELKARGWAPEDLAEVMGCDLRLVNEIITGKRVITPETAAVLGQALESSARYWLNLQSAYQLAQEEGKMTDIKPVCQCGRVMAHAGGAWSGRRRVVKYKCSKCGRTWADTRTLYKRP